MADLATCPPLTRASVVEAHARIRPFVHRTPVLTSRALDAHATAALGGAVPLRLWFKCENLQRGGAFKARGAFHALARLQADPTWVGVGAGAGAGAGGGSVATHSSGNHAQALALAAAAQTPPLAAHIVMPRGANATKVAATRGYGAHVVFSGPTADERAAAAAAVVARTGARLVPPYDHPDIILGAGTAGLELQEQVAVAAAASHPSLVSSASSAGDQPTALLRAPATVTAPPATPPTARSGPPPLDAIVVPCGGGGLLAGTVLSAQGTGIRVFGAEPQLDGADDCARGLAQGRRIAAVPATRTMADGLRTPVGVHNWGVLTGPEGVAGVFAVDEAAIRAALRLVLERLKLVVEPSAAVALAAVLSSDGFRQRVQQEAGPGGWDVGIVLSGGNVSLEALGALFGGDRETGGGEGAEETDGIGI